MEPFIIPGEYSSLDVRQDNSYGMSLVNIAVSEFDEHQTETAEKFLTMQQARELHEYLGKLLDGGDQP